MSLPWACTQIVLYDSDFCRAPYHLFPWPYPAVKFPSSISWLLCLVFNSPWGINLHNRLNPGSLKDSVRGQRGFILLFIYFYFGLHRVFDALHRLSLVVARRGYSLVAVRGLLSAVASRCRAEALGCVSFSEWKSLSHVWLCDPMDYTWNSPDQNTGVGSCFLLQGIFSTQGLNPGLLHCRQILYQLNYEGSPVNALVNEKLLKKP